MENKFGLSAGELRAGVALIQSCLDGMGGVRPSCLEFDELTWVDVNDLMNYAGMSRHEAAGYFSSLQEKGVILKSDGDWCVSTDFWKWLDGVWDGLNKE